MGNLRATLLSGPNEVSTVMDTIVDYPETSNTTRIYIIAISRCDSFV